MQFGWARFGEAVRYHLRRETVKESTYTSHGSIETFSHFDGLSTGKKGRRSGINFPTGLPPNVAAADPLNSLTRIHWVDRLV